MFQMGLFSQIISTAGCEAPSYNMINIKKETKNAMISFIKNLFRPFKKKYIKQLYFSIKLYKTRKLISSCDILIDGGVELLHKKKTKIPHPVGIVIGKDVVIGDGCMINQNVTIGANDLSGKKMPVIGNNVSILSGAVVVGDISIGSRVVIGANSIVTTNVPNNSLVVGFNNIKNKNKNDY